MLFTMNIMSFLSCSILLLWSMVDYVSCKGDLLYVQVMFRHGDRGPQHFYKNDQFKSYWPQGPGHLSPLGVAQQYALGEFLRSRYTDFLGLDVDGVSFADVYVRSTDIERAITSAQTNIAAFFRPPPFNSMSQKAKARSWNTTASDLSMLWQPVPVHTVPQKQDWMMHEADCKRLETLKKRYEESNTMQDIKMRPATQKLLHALSDVTGEPFDGWTISSSFKAVADTLFCEHQHNLTIPDVPDKFYTDIKALLELVWPMPFAEPAVAQLRGGCILDAFVRNMRDKIDGRTNGTYNSRKLVVYSAHDTTVLGIISAAGLLEKVNAQPPYAAAVFFELYADGTVEISYKNDTRSLDAIRTTQPILLLKESLGELEALWRDMRLNETAYESLCEKADVHDRLTPEPVQDPASEESKPVDDHQL